MASGDTRSRTPAIRLPRASTISAGNKKREAVSALTNMVPDAGFVPDPPELGDEDEGWFFEGDDGDEGEEGDEGDDGRLEESGLDPDESPDPPSVFDPVSLEGAVVVGAVVLVVLGGIVVVVGDGGCELMSALMSARAAS
jgi:hypothetical protein